MRSKLDTTLSIILTIAAVTVAGLVVRREVTAGRYVPAGESIDRSPRYVDSWADMLADGVLLGDTSATVRIIEFVDLECPFCAVFHETTLRAALRQYGDAVGVTFMHLPLPTHRFAEPTAHAAECAGLQGQFAEFVGAVFAKQDSLGLKPLSSNARDAGVRDSGSFVRCLAGPVPGRIEAGRSWAKQVGVISTPALIVEGWYLPKPPTEDELIRVIGAIQAGEAPYSLEVGA